MTQTVLICVLVLCVVLKIVSMARKLDAKRKQQAEEHRIEMLYERNEQIILFQIRMINVFGGAVLDMMPEYSDILHSDKPLEAKHWVDVDKLVNLN